MQLVKSSARGGAKAAAPTLRILGLMPLGPCDLVTSSVASTLYTSSGLNSVIMGESGGRGRLVREGAVKELVENVELKKELNRVALLVGSVACESL